MAKAFDIYLNRRITECEILVYSIPYRDDITAIDRLILKSCLETCALYKRVALKSKCGEQITSRLDHLIAFCSERIQNTSVIQSDLKVDIHKFPDLDSSGLTIKDTVKIVSGALTSAQNTLQISSGPVYAQTTRALGSSEFNIEIGSILSGTFKTVYETADSPVIPNIVLVGMKKQTYVSVVPSVILDGHLTDLLYQIYGEDFCSALGIGFSLQGLDQAFSLGQGKNVVVLKSAPIATSVTKNEEASALMCIKSSVEESVKTGLRFEDSQVTISSSVDPMLQRYRTLKDMDESILREYDDLVLADIDLIIL